MGPPLLQSFGLRFYGSLRSLGKLQNATQPYAPPTVRAKSGNRPLETQVNEPIQGTKHHTKFTSSAYRISASSYLGTSNLAIVAVPTLVSNVVTGQNTLVQPLRALGILDRQENIRIRQVEYAQLASSLCNRLNAPVAGSVLFRVPR